MEHRRFHRVKSTALGDLSHQGITYRVRLENLSLGGALLSSEECILIPEGDHCSLSIHFEGEDVFVLTAEIINSFFSMVGVRFVLLEKDAEDRLLQLLRRIPGASALEQKSAAPSAASPIKSRFPLLSKSGVTPNHRATAETGSESPLQAEIGSN
jgi:hypothetical protein